MALSATARIPGPDGLGPGDRIALAKALMVLGMASHTGKSIRPPLPTGWPGVCAEPWI